MTFEKKWFLERHLLERHSDFCWKCPVCKKLFQRRNSPHGSCKITIAEMICFQNSTGLRGPEAEEKLEQYKKTDMVKHMLLVGPEGETLDLDGSVVGKEKAMIENPRKRKGIEETRDKTAKQQKVNSDKEKQETFTKFKKVWDDLSKSPAKRKKENCKERYSSSSSCSSSTSVAVSSSAKVSTSVAESSVANSKASASEAAEVVSQTVREESVERVVLSSSLDEVDVFLQALQPTQEHKVWLNIGGVKYETSKVTLRNDPASVFSLMLLPNSPFRPSGNVFFFDRDPSHFRIILGYLRNNCCMEKRMLPHEPKYLHELIIEARFYKLFGLVVLLEERIKDLCLCKLAVD